MFMVICIFFFFQAEDGIRDWSVTGVQTCALPISASCTRRFHLTAIGGRITDGYSGTTRRCSSRLFTIPRPTDTPAVCGRAERRSEERRVGKEGRAQWAGGQYGKTGQMRVEGECRE